MESYPGTLTQVLTNLIDNALLHGFDGRDHGVIDIEITGGAPGFVVVRFADDGMGIPEGVLPRIFDPFFTTKLGQGGSGLGLNIAYNAITVTLGGTVHVASRPGQGAEFTLTLPLCAPLPARAAPGAGEGSRQ
jgi:signal transduction histidine kinase